MSEYEIQRDQRQWSFDIYWYERISAMPKPLSPYFERCLTEIEQRYPNAKLTRRS